LRDLGGESKRAVDQLRDELERVTIEHAEVKTRLAKLEARLGERSSASGKATGTPGPALHAERRKAKLKTKTKKRSKR
jgi:hypothetical protein